MIIKINNFNIPENLKGMIAIYYCTMTNSYEIVTTYEKHIIYKHNADAEKRVQAYIDIMAVIREIE